MFNEVSLMFVIYPIICFTPFVTNQKRKNEMGLICCSIISLNLIVNLYFLLRDTIEQLIHSYKLWRFKAVL
jgi:hypothetical protein